VDDGKLILLESFSGFFWINFWSKAWKLNLIFFNFSNLNPWKI
jgi:hypothetical protein